MKNFKIKKKDNKISWKRKFPQECLNIEQTHPYILHNIRMD